MARARGARTQMAFAFETVYGTAPATGFRRIPFASASLGAEQPLIENELLGYGRDPLAPTKDAITVDGDMVVPLDARNLGLWLTGAFGLPVTTGSAAPYSHEFQSGAWALPSFTIEKQMPDVPQFSLYTGCMVDQINWSMQRSGNVTATVGLIAQAEANSSTTQAGTLSELALQRFGSFNGVIKRNGTALANVVSAEITYSNNLDRVETIRNDGLIDGADAGMSMLSGSVVTRFANTTLFDQAIAGDPCELAFEYEVSAAIKMTMVAHAVYLPRPRVSIEGPQGIQATFDWQAALAASPARMCTVTLINDVEEY